MDEEGLREVLEYMRKEGRVEWIGGNGGGKVGGDVCWVWWRKVEEWARVIEEWVDETGQKGSILTLYELNEGEGGKGAGMLFVFFFPLGYLRVRERSMLIEELINRISWFRFGNITKGIGDIGEERKGTGFWTGGSAGCEVLLKCETCLERYKGPRQETEKLYYPCWKYWDKLRV